MTPQQIDKFMQDVKNDTLEGDRDMLKREFPVEQSIEALTLALTATGAKPELSKPEMLLTGLRLGMAVGIRMAKEAVEVEMLKGMVKQ